jgi:hypothetical protein
MVPSDQQSGFPLRAYEFSRLYILLVLNLELLFQDVAPLRGRRIWEK